MLALGGWRKKKRFFLLCILKCWNALKIAFTVEKGKNEVRLCVTYVIKFTSSSCVFLFFLNPLLPTNFAWLCVCDFFYVFKIDFSFCFYKINYGFLFTIQMKINLLNPVNFFFFYLYLFMLRPKIGVYSLNAFVQWYHWLWFILVHSLKIRIQLPVLTIIQIELLKLFVIIQLNYLYIWFCLVFVSNYNAIFMVSQNWYLFWFGISSENLDATRCNRINVSRCFVANCQCDCER